MKLLDDAIDVRVQNIMTGGNCTEVNFDVATQTKTTATSFKAMK